MDLSVQKTAKDHLRDQFETWYAEKVASILQAGDDIEINQGMSLLLALESASNFVSLFHWNTHAV